MDIKARRINRPPTAGSFRLIHQDGNLRAMDADGKVYRLRPESGTPVHYVSGTQQV